MTKEKYDRIRQKQVDNVLIQNYVVESKELEEGLKNLFDYGYDIGFIDRK